MTLVVVMVRTEYEWNKVMDLSDSIEGVILEKCF